MAKTSALERLFRVLTVEEEQAQLAVQSAVADLRLLESGLQRALEREHTGRQWLCSTAGGDAVDRFAGLEEIASARRAAQAFRPRIAEQERRVDALREAYIAKRVERRQAETLIEAARKRAAEEAERRNQQMLDDLHLGRLTHSAQERR